VEAARYNELDERGKPNRDGIWRRLLPRVDDVRFVGRRHLDAIAFDEAET
jgi:hypothetical protein